MVKVKTFGVDIRPLKTMHELGRPRCEGERVHCRPECHAGDLCIRCATTDDTGSDNRAHSGPLLRNVMRALIISADNFEDSELLFPYYRLKEEGVQADIVSMKKGKIKGSMGMRYLWIRPSKR